MDFEDPDDEVSETGSIPENTCYVNGSEENCNKVHNHPEMYENDPGAFRLFRNNDTGKFEHSLMTVYG